MRGREWQVVRGTRTMVKGMKYGLWEYNCPLAVPSLSTRHNTDPLTAPQGPCRYQKLRGGGSVALYHEYNSPLPDPLDPPTAPQSHHRHHRLRRMGVALFQKHTRLSHYQGRFYTMFSTWCTYNTVPYCFLSQIIHWWGIKFGINGLERYKSTSLLQFIVILRREQVRLG